MLTKDYGHIPHQNSIEYQNYTLYEILFLRLTAFDQFCEWRNIIYRRTFNILLNYIAAANIVTKADGF